MAASKTSPRADAGHALRIAFVIYHDFTANSAIQLYHLAVGLCGGGHKVIACIPDNKETVELLGEPPFMVASYAEARNGTGPFAGFKPDLIHAWTPREKVRLVTEALAARCNCPYAIHLEDNEDLIVANHCGMAYGELLKTPADGFDHLPEWLSHPYRYRAFLQGAVGVTALIDRLMEFKPAALPGLVFWPGFNEALFKPSLPDLQLRRRLGLLDFARTIVYPGNAHGSNAEEMRSLYIAVAALNQSGIPLQLLRMGTDYVDFLGEFREAVSRYVVPLGFCRQDDVARHMALADALVQPGKPGPFNDYRFPSKLPEFLATGKPVILPATNVGRYLNDGVDCLLLRQGNGLDIAQALRRVFKDAELGATLGRNARSFAEQNLRWSVIAEKVAAFYGGITKRPGRTKASHNAA